MSELADEVDSKSISGNRVRVQVPPSALIITRKLLTTQMFAGFILFLCRSPLNSKSGIIFIMIIPKHHDGSCNNQSVTNKAVHIRYLAKKYKSQDSCKNNLGIIVNRYFFSRGIRVRCGNGKLASRGTQARKQQRSRLAQCHWHKMQQNPRSYNETGKHRKIKNNNRASHSHCT